MAVDDVQASVNNGKLQWHSENTCHTCGNLYKMAKWQEHTLLWWNEKGTQLYIFFRMTRRLLHGNIGYQMYTSNWLQHQNDSILGLQTENRAQPNYWHYSVTSNSHIFKYRS